ncbi:HemK methyltransferase family member 1 [Gracilariopsis chorda]|uniref:peptide chain release factor N(5)-glutamine methyltransferase n=1 Tax=Gracilariopsis chorda TaxID=448386 RepID=A0A2V3ISP8_9FLOR|nr:HemK methyltransferase family member 1 [Gracilariopsis chorda]|eukprot:PXF45148.1 HemK methyltransferase family member 1 [Gracilariopsis chorda]
MLGVGFSSCPWLAVRESETIRSAVSKATHILQNTGIPEPCESAEYLAISSFPRIRTRTEALSSLRKPAGTDLDRFIELCKRRERNRTPIQYLVGDWDFHSITLLVRAPVLIPRPETEELVELVLQGVCEEDANILDVGCGSGAIFLAVLASRPKWTATGVDVAAEAVHLSGDNTELHGFGNRVSILHGTIKDVCADGVFDAIVSNPPYIPARDMEDLDAEVKEHEDVRALCGGEDGLDVVREILEFAPRVVKPGGSIWLEVDSGHPAVLERLSFEEVEYVKTYKDMCGKARFCHLRVR